MDKVRLLNRIKTLSRHLRAGQFLRGAGMERGQEIGLLKKARFCTSGAVDMQWLVHSLPAFWTSEQAIDMVTAVSGLQAGDALSSWSPQFARVFFLKAVLQGDGLATWIASSALPGSRVCFNLIACIQNSSSSKRVTLCG